MSDGKASSYRVVSAEELRRRAVAAARERLDRANQAALELGVLVSAAETTYGALDVVAPVGSPSASDDPAVIDRLAHQVETEVAAARGRAQDAIAKARSRRLEEAAGELLASLRPTEPLAALKRSAPASTHAVGGQMEDALRIVRRLPGDATPESVERCEQLVADVGSVGSEARGAVLLTALRAEVQAARDRSETVSTNRDELARLYRELDGLDGEEVSAVRGHLRGLPLDAPLPAGLAARVEGVRQEALHEQDRRFALQVTREVLEEQGYALGEDFVTVVASADGAVLPLAASRRHGVRVRERAGQLLFNVVRFDKTDDGSSDDEAATAFCQDFETIVHRADQNGLSMMRVVHFEPGSGHMEVREGESPFAETASAEKRTQMRERRSS
jgi:hypothetical protein